MKQMTQKIILTTLLTACGSTKTSEESLKEAKSTEKARLDANTITLSPPPGDYKHGVVVTLKKKDDSSGSGALEIKKEDGSWTLFNLDCFGGVPTGSCVNITKTSTITYRLTTLAGESSEKTVNYSINYAAKADIIVNSSPLKHEQTKCYVSDSSGIKKLRAQIKVTNDVVLGSGKVGYINLEVNDLSKIATPLDISDSSSTGFAIKGAGDSDSFISQDFYPGRNSSEEGKGDKCTVTLSSFKAGESAEGKISCSLSLGTYTDATIIGKSFVLPESDWSCDSWSSLF